MDATRPLTPSLQRPADSGLDFDFEDSGPPITKPGAPELRTVPGAMVLNPHALDFDDDMGRTVVSTTVAGSGGGAGDTRLDFSQFATSEPDSLGQIALTTPGNLDDVLIEGGDPLARKLELAEEFRQIGDIEGARDLLEEVVAKATGTLRVKAQATLDALA